MPAPERVARLADELSLPPLLAALLVQRGCDEPDVARRFLRPSLDELADPGRMRGMGAAVEAIVRAVREGRGLLVHGDYDVDGQCATAILTRALRAAGARVTPFVPHRRRDGYDFGSAGLAAAVEAGAGLIVTCDCGITAVDPVRRAREAGVEVVVTDHHLPGAELPPATAIVDPQLPDDESGLTMLCGAGIAFKLVQALIEPLGLPARMHLHLLDYAALATVADVVDLTGENRPLVRHGLRVLAESRWPGLRALTAASGVSPAELRASHLGFRLGPRLNAAGRLDDAAMGLQLLLTDDADEAARLAGRLDALNKERQALDDRTLAEALEQVDRMADPDRDAGLVLSREGWHPGVVGIVASRVVERYGRPAFLVAFEGEVGKGSGRSIPAVDLHGMLTQCADLLDRFGGHHMAAGLTIRKDRLEEFRHRFAAAVDRAVPRDALVPEQRVDLVVSLGQITEDLERLCRYLEPCGTGNPGPVFGVRNAAFLRPQVVGSNHLRGVLVDASLPSGTPGLSAIGFQWADRADHALRGGRVDATFQLDRNEYRGESVLQARIRTLAPAAA